MSLNWNATKCGDAWKALDPSVQESLIFHTMFVDMGEITEANHQEFYERYVQWNMALGYGTSDLYLSAGDVKAAIGLTTNVFTTTPAAYRKRLAKIMQEKAHEKAVSAFKEQEASNG